MQTILLLDNYLNTIRITRIDFFMNNHFFLYLEPNCELSRAGIGII